MKFLKGLGTVVLAIVLVILITSLSLSTVFRNVLQKDVIINVAKKEIEKADDLESSEKDALYKILNDKRANKVINYIVDDFINYTSERSAGVSKKTVDSIVELVLEYKNDIELVNGEKIDVDELTSESSLKDLENLINKSFNNIVESIDSKNREIVKNITYLFTNSFKLLVMISIVVIILLLMLISCSYYKWLLTFGISSIISGAFVLTLYFILKLVLGYLIKEELNISIDPKIGLIAGIVEMVVGIIAIIIKNKIDKE